MFGIYMKLNGANSIQCEIYGTYEELGVKARFQFKDVTNQVEIQNAVDLSQLGKQTITYQYLHKKISREVEVVDTLPAVLTLIGEEEVIVFQNEAYEEQGIMIQDNSQVDLQDRLQIHHQIDTTKINDYIVTYQVEDLSSNLAMIQRRVHVVENPQLEKLHYRYEAIDNTLQSWWFHKAKDHERKPPSYDAKVLEQYGAIYLGNDEKVIYLTYDEGGNDITYIKEITELLNHHEVQATYFLTRNYIKKEADLMKELVKKGHVIGNHTRSHYNMQNYANEQGLETFVKEINDTQKTIYEVTQQKPAKIFRFPSGEYSERSLAIVHDLGYQTIFWSHAYHDYGEDVSKEEAYNNLITHLHPGAIYLLHPSNKGNLECLNDFIEEVKKQGYRFDVISSIHKNDSFHLIQKSVE